MWEKMQCSVSEVVSKRKASTVPLQIETWSRFISSLMTPDLYIQLGTAALRGGTKILTMACVLRCLCLAIIILTILVCCLQANICY